MAASLHSGVSKLTGENYVSWKFQMKHLLRSQDLFTFVDGSSVKPADDAEEAVKIKYVSSVNKAYSLLALSVSTDLIYLISDCEEPVTAWNKLKAHFERNTLGNKLYLKKLYFRSMMSEGTPIEEHLKFMKELTDKLAAVDAVITEEDQVVTLLGSLPTSFDNLVTALEARVDDISLSFVHQALLNDELKRRDVKPATIPCDRALASTGKRFSSQKRDVTCFQCGERGHIRRNCPKGRPMQMHSGNQVGNQVGNCTGAVIDDTAFGATESSSQTESTYHTTNSPWIIDSGASRHMTGRKELFSTYEKLSTPEKVSVGDGRILDAIGHGTVKVELTHKRTRKQIRFEHVLHVPDLAVNLFSVRAVTDKGYIVQFGKRRCWVKDGKGYVKAMGALVDRMYLMDCELVTDFAAVSCDVWHQRLGHAGESTLKHMHKNSLVVGADLHGTPSSFCEPCVKGKMARVSFPPVGEIKTKRQLELVHSDVCGPMENTSIGGCRYFVTFIDDYTRYSSVYFIKEKSEVFTKFKQFATFVENQTGLHIGTLRSDRGGEYLSNEFAAYLSEKGIHHQLTAGYSPQQNGVAERYNRTICESARAMLVQAELPKRFWAEAMSTAVYVRNRVFTSALKCAVTPFQRWFNIKPNVSHLRVFGCVCYAHIPDQLRQKLDAKAQKLRFMGYSSQTKGYKLYDESTGKMVVRRDVSFREDSFSQENENGNDQSPQTEQLDASSDGSTSQSSVPELQSGDHPRRTERISKPPVRFGYDEYAENVAHHVAYRACEIVEPATFQEARESAQSKEWMAAAQTEYDSLASSKTWELVELPPDRRPVGCKWVFKVKITPDGSVDRFKGRLVAKGYSQEYGVDYDETFAPVVSFTAVRTLLSYGLQRGMVVGQMDVVTAFLNGCLEEEIYMTQPEGFEKPGESHLVCKLRKSLYGLKQSPRCWNGVLDSFLKSIGFENSSAELCVYVRDGSGIKTIITVYVDDLIILSDSQREMDSVKAALSAKFKMKDMGDLRYCLGINIECSDSTTKLQQTSYIESVLKRFNMENANSVSTPSDVSVKLVKDDGSKLVDKALYQAMIGSMLYIAIATRPDIAHAVGVLSRFNSCPNATHLTAAKRVLRYLKGTKDVGLTYTKGSELVTGYTDASWADSLDDRHSTSGVIFIYGGGPICWMSKRQSVVALSTAEAEYIALFNGTREAKWLKTLFSHVTGLDVTPLAIMVDNQAAISMAKNVSSSSRTKHIDMKYHFVRECVSSGIVTVAHCASVDMLADVLTKSLASARFTALRNLLNVVAVGT